MKNFYCYQYHVIAFIFNHLKSEYEISRGNKKNNKTVIGEVKCGKGYWSGQIWIINGNGIFQIKTETLKEHKELHKLHVLFIYGALNKIIEQRISADESYINSELYALKEIYPDNKIYKGVVAEIH